MREEIKCGEVFRNEVGKYSFNCCFCSDQLYFPIDILEHTEMHFNQMDLEDNFENPKTIKLECTTWIDDDTERCELEYTADEDEENYDAYEDEENYDAYELNEIEINVEKQFEEAITSTPSLPIVSLKTKKNKPTENNIETEEPLVKCTICGLSLAKNNLKLHKKVHQAYECGICRKGFNKKTTLYTHITKHSDSKEYICDICGWHFRTKSNLTQHFLKHTGAKPYKCNICQKGFSQSSYVKVHMRIHTGEKQYQCSVCGVSFYAQNSLTQHIKNHNKQRVHKCNLCNKAYYRSSTLNEHKRVHTGERPYKCGLCGKTFARRHLFVQHKVLHSGLKPYSCRFCEMAFAQTAGRRSHEKVVHKVQ